MAVTLDTIASKLGVSKATVSLGLRGSPRISDALRTRIAHAAVELGYAPNPMVSALMVSLRAQRPHNRASSLCFLTAYPSRDGWHRVAAFARYHEGALRRAEALGYGLEIHWARDPELSGDRLTRILQARGIPGILIAPLPPGAPRLTLDFSRFASVAYGYTFKQEPVHRVTNHQFNTVLTALEACRARGYRRIGLAITQGSNLRVNRLWFAGFLTFQASHTDVGKVAPLVAVNLDQAALLSWLEKEHPDVVVSTEIGVRNHLLRAGRRIPEDIGYVHLDWVAEHGDLAAMDQRPDQIGEASVDLLVEQINQNRRGQPAVPRTVLIDGVWRDGPTLPPRRPGLRGPRAKVGAARSSTG